MNEDERIRALSGFDPLSDTGRAIKFFWQKVVSADKAEEELRETIVFTAKQNREWQAELKRLSDKIDESTQKPKIDGWKFLRSVAAKIVGDIDNLNK